MCIHDACAVSVWLCFPGSSGRSCRDRSGEASVWKDWGSTHYPLGYDGVSEYH